MGGIGERTAATPTVGLLLAVTSGVGMRVAALFVMEITHQEVYRNCVIKKVSK